MENNPPFQMPSVPQVPAPKKKPSITTKLLVIILLIIILLIPWALLEFLIYDRERTSENAISEVSEKWSREQTVRGPVLYIPYQVWNGQNNVTSYLKILPEELTYKGNVTPNMRYRGIYEVMVYESDLAVAGSFKIPEYALTKVDPKKLEWEKAFLGVGVTDMRGIKEQVKLNLNGKYLVFNPGIEGEGLSYGSNGGISVPVEPDSLQRMPGAEWKFSFQMKLNGSKELYFEPLGKTTIVQLNSSYRDPSFSGAFLPNKPADISKDGFKAEWKVLNLNRNYPQVWSDDAFNTYESRFGIDFKVPVDHYLKSARASKYAILIIGLSFMVYFFVEILQKLRIHPFQYVLVGLAICVFYTLLLSLSEHIGFNAGYWVSAIATIGAITMYSSWIFNNRKSTLLMGAIMTLLYGFMFVIIQLQDYALLVGSISIFAVLLVIMWLSRKINWYEDEQQQ
jgi:inner membrane protein